MLKNDISLSLGNSRKKLMMFPINAEHVFIIDKNRMFMLIQTRCAICNTLNNASLVYKEKLPSDGIDSEPYAPRRKRDYYHYKMVKCNTCGLVRSDPIISHNDLPKLYHDSKCTYTDVNENTPLKRTYGKYLEHLIKNFGIKRDSYLDIGCANGFMLEKAQEFGFTNIVGVEPSHDAIERAGINIKSKIKEGMFDENMFEPEQFDVITFFQTFDHVTEPNKFLENCHKTLKQNGFILAINHNVNSLSAKILGERSPIFDIGHAYLYDLNTMRTIFEKNHFKVHSVFPVKNTISIGRIIQLLPTGKKTFDVLEKIISKTGLESVNLPLYVGNLGIIAQRA